MSVQMMGAVINCGPQERTQYCVMVSLANYADEFGFCFPQQTTIARDSRCDPKTARETLKELERRGWIYIARKVLNGKCNVYMLNLERLGVVVPAGSRRSPVFTRLLKKSPGVMTPIFRPEHDPLPRGLEVVEEPVEDFAAPENSAGMAEFSGDNPQGVQRASDASHRAFEGVSPGIALPPNRYNHQSYNRQEPPEEIEPLPTPPWGGDNSFSEATAETTLSPETLKRWENFRLGLKSDLLRMVPTETERRFIPVRTGQSDFDTCFREWWLERLVGTADTWTFTTSAGDPAATDVGMVKYEARLERTLRLYFPIAKSQKVRLVLQRRDGEAGP